MCVYIVCDAWCVTSLRVFVCVVCVCASARLDVARRELETIEGGEDGLQKNGFDYWTLFVGRVCRPAGCIQADWHLQKLNPWPISGDGLTWFNELEIKRVEENRNIPCIFTHSVCRAKANHLQRGTKLEPAAAKVRVWMSAWRHAGTRWPMFSR